MNENMVGQKIVVRFPPSPTGEIHIGNVRTLLFNYLFAKKNNGKIVFRFEDTDPERSKKEYEKPMLDALMNLGLSWDEGPFRQTDRIEIYRKYLKLLVEAGLAYEDKENNLGTGKIIRLKNIEREIVWMDLVKGEIKINTHTFKERDESGNFTGENAADIIIARSITDPIYHFTVVVDDWLMGVTHVIRGDDHITSTPRQIMILEALRDLKLTEEPQVIIPQYAHLPTIIGADKKKLSKRNGNTSLQKYLNEGYLKETLVNYLAFLGWNPGGEREFFSLEELVNEFSLEKCQKSPAQFDILKLDNINKHYLSKLTDEEFVNYIKSSSNKNYDEKIIKLIIRPRIANLLDFGDMEKNGEIDFAFENTYDLNFKNFDLNNIIFKGKKVENISPLLKGADMNEVNAGDLVSAKNAIRLVKEKIENIESENWNIENLKKEIWDWSGTVGRGQFLHPLRMIMSLKEKSPDPFTIMEIVGKNESLRRINSVI